ncbi:MAG: cytochrome c3 family protein [Deltaproteobacteria bacterium]|nr:cytochrome c3 family protein [Deltaproteobacteria bacterium]
MPCCKKKWGFIFSVCLIVVATSVIFIISYADTGDCGIWLNNRPPVDFLDNYHDTHMENLDCLDCHHKYLNGKNVLDEDDLEEGNPDILCSSCHKDNSKLNLRRAFHKQCIGCHDKLSAKGERRGPSLCGECHSRHKVESGSLTHGGKNG